MTKKLKTIVGLTVALILFVGLIGSNALAFQGPVENNEKVDILIGFHEVPGSSERNVVRGHGGEIYREFSIVNVIAARMTSQAADALAQNSGVRYVEPDGPVYALDQTVPWGIERVFGDESYSFDTWEITEGEGIAVAILDTGIDENHEDLPALSGGVNTIDDTHWGSDGSGHGTHVAGTVAALDNEIGVVGVGPEVGLYAVKVLNDDGGGTISSVVSGIEWAVEQNIPILNMSLGTGTHYDSLQEASDAAYEAGHLLVAAAGNSGNSPGRGDNVGYPAAYESVIAVAASDDNDKRARWSSTGPAVELIAPGVSVFSTLPDDSYGTYNGTSMASPHVAGAAALTWAASTDLTNIEIREILQDTAEDLELDKNHQGHGLVRADLAVREAKELEPSTTGNIKGTVTDGNNGLEGATVKIEEIDYLATTDENGEYAIDNVEDDTYDITASKDGYGSETKTVEVDSDTTVDFVLEETEDVAPVIDKFELTDTSNPQWARVEVDWAVSDEGGNLDTVELVLKQGGNEKDSETISVSGSEASSEDQLRERGGHSKTYDVTITVTDTDGNDSTKTEQIDL